ncbi:polyprenol reductase [Patella vulgata]|uniref:polyprenol reductase n=1 Tax=Patella vulgata TaxID=6465 RepID=UPI00217FB32B|nr:polyprenol reductase [Patella vulgata]
MKITKFITVGGILHNLFYFGKLRDRKYYDAIGRFRFLDVPKRYFLHFYIVGVIFNTAVICVFVNAIYRGKIWPSIFREVFDILNYPNISKNSQLNGFNVIIVLLMEEVQVIRRLYECVAVHIFSESKMSIIHYGIGLLFYCSFSCGVLSEVDPNHIVQFKASLLEVVILSTSIVIFSLSWYKQHSTFKILANLRTYKKDSKTSLQHFLPNGDLFHYVSCPHFFTEILIYFAMNLVLKFHHTTGLCYLLFICVNQVTFGLITHSWYKQTFPSYPKHRRAVIPFIL